MHNYNNTWSGMPWDIEYATNIYIYIYIYSARNGLVHAGIPYRNLFLFLNSIPALTNIWYRFLFFSILWRYIIVFLLISIPALLNFQFERERERDVTGSYFREGGTHVSFTVPLSSDLPHNQGCSRARVVQSSGLALLLKPVTSNIDGVA
jgi:hypothetical protein